MSIEMNAVYRPLRALGAIILLAALVSPSIARADQLPVLMVLANRDFWYQEYANVRKELAAQRLKVVVAASSTADAIPQERDVRRVITPDVALNEVDASKYSAIVFVGGWGASSYQYAFAGTYASPAYQPDSFVTDTVNGLIGDFVAQGKPVAALSHAVTVLAWARVDGVSLLQGRTVAAWAGGSPAFEYEGQTYHNGTIAVPWHVIQNGGSFRTMGSTGGPLTSADDVVVDGRIITGENYDSAPLFAKTLALAIAGR